MRNLAKIKNMLFVSLLLGIATSANAMFFDFPTTGAPPTEPTSGTTGAITSGTGSAGSGSSSMDLNGNGVIGSTTGAPSSGPTAGAPSPLTPFIFSLEDFWVKDVSEDTTEECNDNGDANDLEAVLEMHREFNGNTVDGTIVFSFTSANKLHDGYPLLKAVNESGERLFKSISTSEAGLIYDDSTTTITDAYSYDIANPNAKYTEITNGILEQFTQECFTPDYKVGIDHVEILTNNGDQDYLLGDCAGASFTINFTLDDISVGRIFGTGLTVDDLTDTQISSIPDKLIAYYNSTADVLLKYKVNSMLIKTPISVAGAPTKTTEEQSCALRDMINSCAANDCVTDGVDFKSINISDFFGSNSVNTRNTWKNHVNAGRVKLDAIPGTSRASQTGINDSGVYKNVFEFNTSAAFASFRNDIKLKNSIGSSVRKRSKVDGAAKNTNSTHHNVYLNRTRPGVAPQNPSNVFTPPAPIVTSGVENTQTVNQNNQGTLAPGATCDPVNNQCENGGRCLSTNQFTTSYEFKCFNTSFENSGNNSITGGAGGNFDLCIVGNGDCRSTHGCSNTMFVSGSIYSACKSISTTSAVGAGTTGAITSGAGTMGAGQQGETAGTGTTGIITSGTGTMGAGQPGGTVGTGNFSSPTPPGGGTSGNNSMTGSGTRVMTPSLAVELVVTKRNKE